jgi:hypothetical protein
MCVSKQGRAAFLTNFREVRLGLTSEELCERQAHTSWLLCFAA